MKRVLIFLLTAAILAMGWGAAHAAGTVTVSQYYLSQDQKVMIIKLACVGDASDGSVPDTAITSSSVSSGLPSDYYRMGFYIFDVWAIAGSVTAPDAADVTITDTNARTIYDEDNIIPASGTNEGTVSVKAVVAPITVSHQNQGTVDATWDLYILLAR